MLCFQSIMMQVLALSSALHDGCCVSCTGGFTADVEAHGAVVLSITLVNTSAAHEAWRPWDGGSATAGGPIRIGRRRAARRGRKGARANVVAGRAGGDMRRRQSRGTITQPMSSEK